ncbi:unnamed protein product [Clonostachys solani]|uniref:Mitochondrial import inner membrane translocase subunit TIM50 n=1 Tax=Clonostachys solani TaxID=160281 RepID=A0A9N9ZDQ9_9HYPO|nr:unnamed protein product [Clonostachys solani]
MSDHNPTPPTNGPEFNVAERTIAKEQVATSSVDPSEAPQAEVVMASKKKETTTKGIKRKKKIKAPANGKTTQNADSMPWSRSKKEERDPVRMPSQESGGVPDPSADYLAQAAGPPSTLAQPRRILVVLDLNGTLLYRPSKRRPFHFVARPHARKFMEYCLDTFQLAIWSSARPQNVHKMVEKLLTPEDVARCVVVWSREHFGLSTEDYDSRVQVYKRLTRLWTDTAVIASHPDAATGSCWDQTNTVLVDDSLEKGRSEPHNLLTIPEFSGLENESAEVLPQVHDFLNALCWQSDVSRYIRQTSFQLDEHYKLVQ